MSARKKIFLWCIGAMGAVLVLRFLLPFYINSPGVKERIRSSASSALGGTVTYQRLDLSLLPLPHVTVEQPALSVPGSLAATLRSLSIYPQLFPLVRGKVLVSELRLQDPELRITLRETAPQTGTATLADGKSAVRDTLRLLNALAPGLVVRISRGALALSTQERRVLSLTNFDAQCFVRPDGIAVRSQATSDRWGAVALGGEVVSDDGSITVRDLSGTLGHSTISGFMARIAWGKPARLEVLSGKASFSLKELRQWLAASGHLPAPLKDVKDLQGTVAFASVTAGGPVLDPSAWKWRVTGSAENVRAESAILPAPLVLAGQFIAEQDRLALADASASLGRTSVARVSAWFDWKSGPKFRVSSGRAVVALGELFAWRGKFKQLAGAFGGVTSLDGTFRLSAMNFGGLLAKPGSWQTHMTGDADAVVIATPRLPGPVTFRTGSFGLDSKTLSFTNVQATVRDASCTLSGSLNAFPGRIGTTDLSGSGTIGPEMVQWLYTTLNWPSGYLVNAPVSLAEVHILWQRDAGMSFAGSLDIARGPVLFLDARTEPGKLVIRKATVKDRRSDAVFSLTSHAKALDLSFNGTLAQSTLNRLFIRQTFGSGKLTGSLKATVLIDRPPESSAHGMIEGDDIIVPWGRSLPLRISTVRLHANGNFLTIAPSSFTLGTAHYDVSGTASPSTDGFVLAGDLAADRIDVAELQKLLARPEEQEEGGSAKTAKPRAMAVRGLLRVKAQDLVFGAYTAHPARAEVAFGPDYVNAAFSRAKVCDISIPGTLDLSRGDLSLDFRATAAGQQLEQALICLSGANVNISGTYDLNAEAQAQGRGGALMPSLEGKVDFSARDGKIYRYPLLAKIFSVLSVTEILRGKVPELGGDGFPYTSFVVKGDIHGGVFKIDQAIIEGSSIDLIASGDVDLAGRKMDMVVLVSPFSTVNWILRHIPLVGRLMSGNLVSVPVRVSGDLADPEVTFLSPTAVGSRLIELLKNVLKLPFEIISPLLPKEPEKRN